MSELFLKKGDTLLFTGDSVTDCERLRPVGEGLSGGLGQGYPNIVSAALALDYPGLDPDILNTASSGDTSAQLRARWQQDVLDLPRDVVSVLIGVNDVWRQFDHLNDVVTPPTPAEYRANLTYFADSLADGGTRRLLLLTPFFLELHRDDPFRGLVDEYAEQARVVAASRPGFVRLVDTQRLFDSFLERRHYMTIASDRVHPNLTGHLLIARAVLAGLDSGTAAITAGTGQARLPGSGGTED